MAIAVTTCTSKLTLKNKANKQEATQKSPTALSLQFQREEISYGNDWRIVKELNWSKL